MLEVFRENASPVSAGIFEYKAFKPLNCESGI